MSCEVIRSLPVSFRIPGFVLDEFRDWLVTFPDGTIFSFTTSRYHYRFHRDVPLSGQSLVERIPFRRSDSPILQRVIYYSGSD